MAKVHIVFDWYYDDGAYIVGVFAKKVDAKQFVKEETARQVKAEAKKLYPSDPSLRIESHKVKEAV